VLDIQLINLTKTYCKLKYGAQNAIDGHAVGGNHEEDGRRHVKAGQINAETEQHGQSHGQNLSGDQFVINAVHRAAISKI